MQARGVVPLHAEIMWREPRVLLFRRRRFRRLFEAAFGRVLFERHKIAVYILCIYISQARCCILESRLLWHASVWKGQLTFGLVSFPVRLFSAARSETISFNQLHKDDNSRIRQVTYCQAEDKPVPRSELVKGYEYEKDRYVVIDDEDIKKVAPKTAKVMEILEFVKAEQVDPVYLESSYYVAPDEGGEKPYALLFQALRESKYYALAKVAMHNREHIIVLRPGAKGILSHTMYYQDEIRQVDEFRTDTSLVKEKELEMAKMLISSLEAEFEPQKYHDEYRENLRQ